MSDLPSITFEEPQVKRLTASPLALRTYRLREPLVSTLLERGVRAAFSSARAFSCVADYGRGAICLQG